MELHEGKGGGALLVSCNTRQVLSGTTLDCPEREEHGKCVVARSRNVPILPLGDEQCGVCIRQKVRSSAVTTFEQQY